VIGRAVLVAGRARQLGALEVHLIGQIGHVIVLLRNRGRAKGIGLDQVGAGGQVFSWMSRITSGRVSDSSSLLP
jgi:hypothetical protein